MKKLIIANWKMNPDSLGEAVRLAKMTDRAAPRGSRVVVAPSFPYLLAVSLVLRRAELGAQDVFWEARGAYTGEVSVRQLRNLGVRYAIVGHSERRALHETDEAINRKVKTALKGGLKVVLCVGEPWSVRKRGFAAAKTFVRKQLRKNLSGVGKNRNLIIAYEPVWAIGTGRSDRPEETAAMIEFIKNSHPNRVLYGGSVTAKNAKNFLNQKEVDGALVGGASLRSDFGKILKLASQG